MSGFVVRDFLQVVVEGLVETGFLEVLECEVVQAFTVEGVLCIAISYFSNGDIVRAPVLTKVLQCQGILEYVNIGDVRLARLRFMGRVGKGCSGCYQAYD